MPPLKRRTWWRWVGGWVEEEEEEGGAGWEEEEEKEEEEEVEEAAARARSSWRTVSPRSWLRRWVVWMWKCRQRASCFGVGGWVVQ